MAIPPIIGNLPFINKLFSNNQQTQPNPAPANQRSSDTVSLSPEALDRLAADNNLGENEALDLSANVQSQVSESDVSLSNEPVDNLL